jgi:chromosome segregation ATPase
LEEEVAELREALAEAQTSAAKMRAGAEESCSKWEHAYEESQQRCTELEAVSAAATDAVAKAEAAKDQLQARVQEMTEALSSAQGEAREFRSKVEAEKDALATLEVALKKEKTNVEARLAEGDADRMQLCAKVEQAEVLNKELAVRLASMSEGQGEALQQLSALLDKAVEEKGLLAHELHHVCSNIYIYIYMYIYIYVYIYIYIYILYISNI